MNRLETISQVPADKAFKVSEGELSILIEENTFQSWNILSKDLKFHKCYLKMAEIWGNNSYAKRKKVGSLIVKNKRIISDGYNGTPAGFSNVCETENNESHPYVLHAEANAITKVAKSNNNCEDSDLYITMSPCLDCCKLIIQSGIKRIIFSELYRDMTPLNLLEEANIDYYYIPINDV